MGKKEADIDLNEVPEFPGAKPKKGFFSFKKEEKSVEIPDLPMPDDSPPVLSIETNSPEDPAAQSPKSAPAPGAQENAAPEQEMVSETPSAESLVAKEAYLDDLKVQLQSKLEEINKKKDEPFITHRSLKELNAELQKVNEELTNIHI